MESKQLRQDLIHREAEGLLGHHNAYSRYKKGLPNGKPFLFDMARSGGFEPPTAWFVARYSIQLSYERVVLKWGELYGFNWVPSTLKLKKIMKKQQPMSNPLLGV